MNTMQIFNPRYKLYEKARGNDVISCLHTRFLFLSQPVPSQIPVSPPPRTRAGNCFCYQRRSKVLACGNWYGGQSYLLQRHIGQFCVNGHLPLTKALCINLTAWTRYQARKLSSNLSWLKAEGVHAKSICLGICSIWEFHFAIQNLVPVIDTAIFGPS